MSEERQTIPSGAVEQGARAAQVEDDIPTDADVIEQMKRQLAEFEERDRQIEAERKAERAQLESERRAREAAERRASEAQGRASQETQVAVRSADEARLDAINASLTSHDEKMASLKSQYAAAGAEGDFAKMGDIQAEMAILGGQIVQLRQGKQTLEARQQQPREAQPEDQRESFIRQQPPILQDWLRRNDRYFTDSVFRNRVSNAAGHAQANLGIAFDSQDLIDYVEEQVGLRRQEPPRQESPRQEPRPPGRDADATDRSQNRMTAAPAGGSVPNTSRTSGNDDQVYLTRDEKEQARRDGISEADWAKAKRDLIREGQIGPTARNR